MKILLLVLGTVVIASRESVAARHADDLTADQIFLKTRDAINSLQVPSYIQFTFVDKSSNQIVGRNYPVREILRIVERTADGHAFVRTMQAQSGFRGRMAPVVVGADGLFPNTNVYRLGDFPISAFGLRTSAARPGMFEANSRKEPSPEPSPLSVLARVSVADIPYEVTRLDDVSIAGRPAYHIKLNPRRNPGHNVLRELVVDRATFEPCSYVVERYVGSPVVFSYLVQVDAQVLEGFLVNTSLAGHFSVPFLDYGKPAGSINPNPVSRDGDVDWSITDISFPTDLPDWLFDPSQFAAHKDDQLPAFLENPGYDELPSMRRLEFSLATTQGTRSTSPSTEAISIDVVAATPDDQGLVVDLRRDSKPQSVARIAITSTGRLLFRSNDEPTIAESAVLHLLGRRVIGPDEKAVGDVWQSPGDPAIPNAWSFQVADRPGGSSREVLTVSGEDGRLRGTVTYDPTRMVPISADLRESPPEGTSQAREIRILLLRDSFEKQP